MKIGLLGLAFDSGNMGCNALSYSFLRLIKKNAHSKVEVIAFDSGNHFESFTTDKIICKSSEYSFRKLSSLIELYKELKHCDIVFDFTAGDSFSDIYGIKRMIRVSFVKILTIISGTKLVLGPQTYGPYKKFLSKKLAQYIVRKSYYACSRDELSAKLVKDMCGLDIDVFTDVAFGLEYEKKELESMKGRTKIGINISGLLWNGGYKGKNEFNLTLDYKQYSRELIAFLCKDNRYQVFLIPHVISSVESSVENDYAICKVLAQEFPVAVVAPPFKSPVEVKNYIAAMDIFFGARMHATVAAFSSGVVTIPIAYSRKFNGLYNNIGYNYIIDALKMNNNEAIEKSIEYIEKHRQLSEIQLESIKLVENRLNNFYDKYAAIISDVDAK